MSLEQAHAAIRAGIEIGDALPGNLVACAGIGVGSHESAALVLSRLGAQPVRDFVVAGAQADEAVPAPLMALLQGVQRRHRDIADPVEAVAAFGGFEIAMMVGLMLLAGKRRQLIWSTACAACAAVLAAARIAPAVLDYCIFCRSTAHRGLDRALALFGAEALPGPGLESIDGTGAALAFRCCAARWRCSVRKTTARQRRRRTARDAAGVPAPGAPVSGWPARDRGAAPRAAAASA